MYSRRRKDFGQWGENLACAFLERHRFFIKEKNYYSTVGEIDIVAEKDGDYYFVEVKTRIAGELANDLAITKEKRRRLHKTVKHYCYHRGIGEAGLISAGIIISINKVAQQAKIRFFILN